MVGVYMNNYPGKVLTYQEAKEYLIESRVQYASPTSVPHKNYNREDISSLPNLIVYIAETKTYYLMTPEEFLSEKVQNQWLKEKGDYFGEMVAGERVGS